MDISAANRMLSGSMTPVTKLKVLLKVFQDYPDLYSQYYCDFISIEGEKLLKQRITPVTLCQVFKDE